MGDDGELRPTDAGEPEPVGSTGGTDRRWQWWTAGAVMVLVVVVVVAATRGGGSGGSADGTTSTTDRARAAWTTTPTTVASGEPGPGAPAPGGGSAAGGDGPAPPSATVPIAQGAVIAEDPGACRYDPQWEELSHSGTVTNLTGDAATIEVEVTWIGPGGEELAFGTEVFGLEHGEGDRWTVSADWAPDSEDSNVPIVPPFRCVVSVR